jgi:hypothetical protein
MFGFYLILFYLQFGPYIKAEYWLRDIQIVKTYIQRSTSSPKIIILSGSNSLFGLDSKELSKYLEIPVVNLSTHGGLSLDYILGRNVPYLNRGDIVCLPLEYEYYATNEPYTQWFTDQVIAWDKAYFEGLSIVNKIKFISSVSALRLSENLINKCLKKNKRWLLPPEEVIRQVKSSWKSKNYNNEYHFRNLNNYGDLINTQNNIRLSNINYPVFEKEFYISKYAKNQLTKFFSYCQNNDIQVFITWPCSIKSYHLDFKKKFFRKHIEEIKNFIDSQAVTVIGEPEDFIFDEFFFSDTRYHLNNFGKKLRTLKLASILLKKIEYSQIQMESLNKIDGIYKPGGNNFEQKVISLKRQNIDKAVVELKNGFEIQLKDDQLKEKIVRLYYQTDKKAEAVRLAKNRFIKGHTDWNTLSVLLHDLSNHPDADLGSKLTKVIINKDLPGKRVMDNGRIISLGFAQDSWTIDGKPGFLVIKGFSDVSYTPNLWLGCYADSKVLPITVTIKNGSKKIKYTFAQPERSKVSLPEVKGGKTDIFCIETDKSWIPDSKDKRMLGVQVTISK